MNLIFILIFQVQIFALDYEGTLLDSSGTPIAESNVKIKAEIFDNGVSCILYEREFVLDLSNSNGYFSLDLSVGTAPTGQPHETNDLADVLSNANGNSVKCADNSDRNFNGTFVKRQIRLTILEIDGTDISDISLPMQNLNESPFSRQASSVINIGADQVGSAQVADGAVTNAKIASGIDASKLTGTLPAIDGSALTGIAASSLAANSVGTTEIADDAVGPNQLADTSVSAGSYGSASQIATFTVDAQGRITSAGNVSITDNDTTDLASMSGDSDDIAGGSVNLFMTVAERNKLTNISAGAQPDMTESEILSTLTNDSVSGDKVDGGSISNFASTGIDDNSLSTVMTIDSDGEIGVGTANPAFPLHLRTASPGNDFQALMIGNADSGTIGTAVTMYLSASNTKDRSAGLRSTKVDGGNGSDLQFMTNSSGSTPAVRMRINSVGDVGIGTTTPLSKIHLSGGDLRIGYPLANEANGITIYNESASAAKTTNLKYKGDTFYIAPSTANQTYNIGRVYNSTGSHVSSMNFDINSNASPSQFNFLVDNSSKLTIDESGRIGIGTSTPIEQLHVNGNINVPYTFKLKANGNTANDDLLSNAYDASVISGGADKLVIAPTGNSRSVIQFSTTDTNAVAPVPRVTIDHGGNVGIGTTSPTGKLDIVSALGTSSTAAGGGNLEIQRNETISPTTGGFIDLKKNSGEDYRVRIYYDEESPAGVGGLVVSTNTDGSTFSPNLIVSGAGMVGVGTTSPQAKLDISGDVKIGNSSATCDSSTEGSQRYNFTSKKMEFCNGTTWGEFGGPSVTLETIMVSAASYTTPPDNAAGATSTVTCTAGYVVTGGGCETVTTEVHIISSIMSGNGWSCRGYQMGGSSTAKYRAIAMCARLQ